MSISRGSTVSSAKIAFFLRQERSTGRACRASNRMDDEDRSSSYGYVTQYQHEEGEEAIRSSNRLISGYVQMED